MHELNHHPASFILAQSPPFLNFLSLSILITCILKYALLEEAILYPEGK